MIDHVMLMNLKRRDDKWYFALGNLQHAGFRLNRVIRFHSHDGLDYDSTDAIIKAAVADDFPYFVNYNDEDNKLRRAQLCWFWTYVSALRDIVRMNKRVMLLIDDVLPVRDWSWDRLCALTEECIKADKREGRSFRGIQLRHACNPTRRLPKIEIYSSVVSEGLYGLNENGYILSKSGADMFLNVYEEVFPLEIIFITEFISKRGVTNKRYRSGFWTVLDEVIGDYDGEPWKKSDLWGLRLR